MKRYKRYDLYGYIVARTWMGGYGFKNLHLITDENGLKEIKDDPLQDFINFGVERVVYAEFDVFLTEIEETAEYVINKQIKTPVDHIKEGSIPKEAESVMDYIYEDEYETVKY